MSAPFDGAHAQRDTRQGDTREARIGELLPLVRQIARRVRRMVPSAEVDDLIGDGSVGLIRAIDGFDPARGVPLEQYARRLILGAMLNGVRRMDPVAERMRRTIRIAERARYALAHQLGTIPTLHAMEAYVPALARARTEAHRRIPLSLDAPLPTGERLAPDSSGDPQAVVAASIERERLRGAIAALPQRERQIVLAHYFCERPLRELVAPLRVSPQRVSQLHLLAVERLRAALTDVTLRVSSSA
jgi:RNA polymerase sigma factor for flagellar operon FliA